MVFESIVSKGKIYYYDKSKYDYKDFFKYGTEFRFDEFTSASLVKNIEIFTIHNSFKRYYISNFGRFWDTETRKFVESFAKADNANIALITLNHSNVDRGPRSIRKIEVIYEAFFGKANDKIVKGHGGYVEIKYSRNENEENFSFSRLKLIAHNAPSEEELGSDTEKVNMSMKEKLKERRSKKLKDVDPIEKVMKVDKKEPMPPKQTKEKHRDYLFKLDPDSAKILDGIKKKYKTTSDATAIKVLLKLYSENN